MHSRTHSLTITHSLILLSGYFIPAIMQRIPSGLAYDEDMKVFVYDIETHDAYRRGKAVERQDKVTIILTHPLTHPSTHSLTHSRKDGSNKCNSP